MKYIFLLALVIVFITNINGNSNESEKHDILGIAYNNEDKPVTAIAYGDANPLHTQLESGITYSLPEYVDKLAENVTPPIPGIAEPADEIPSTVNYYQGDLKLNTIKINCKVNADETNCWSQSNCGWCGSSGQCIAGTNIGPLEPCVTSSYLFSPPIPNWQAKARMINHNVGGVSLNILHKSS